MNEQVIEQPPVDTPPPPVEAAPPVVDTPVVTPPPVDEDAALDASLEAQAIEVPDGDKLVPLSAVKELRAKLKEAKAGTAAAATLQQQLDQAQQQIQAIGPLAEAFRALQQAQQGPPPQPPAPAGPTAEDTAALEDIARVFDFYKADGTLDTTRAQKHRDLVRREAASIAQQTTAPLVANSLQERAAQNLARAKATVHPVSKQGADPAILEQVVAQIANQPNGLETLANPDAMKQLWLNAYALSTFKAQAQPQAPVVTPPPGAPPLVTERAGGLVPDQPSALSPAEKRAAKDAGLTEKAYLEIAKGMKW